MKFLYPPFLWALGVIGIPLIIHLFGFRSTKKVYLSSTRLLSNLVITRKGRKLQDRALLALRTLALAFLVFCFAYPVKRDVPLSEDYSNVVYLDNSLSMSLPTSEGSLLDLAKRICVKGLKDGVKYRFITNEFAGDEDALTANQVREKVAATDYYPADRSLEDVIDRAKAGSPNRVRIYALSDFQRSAVLKPSHTTDLTAVPVRGKSSDVSLDSLWLTTAPDERKLVVKLTKNDPSIRSVKLRLKLNEKLILIKDEKFSTDVLVDTLDIPPVSAPNQALICSVEDAGFTFNNTLYELIGNRMKAVVYVINGGRTSPFIKSLFAEDSSISFFQSGELNLDAGNIKASNLIVLNQLHNFSEQLTLLVKYHLSKGGTLLYLPSIALEPERLDYGRDRAFLNALQVPFPVKVELGADSVVELNLKDPLFEGVFEKIAHNPALPTARKYVKYSSLSQLRPLLRLKSGNYLLAVASRNKGKIYVCAAPFEDSAQNLQRQALVVPLLYRMAWQSVTDCKYKLTGQNELTSNGIFIRKAGYYSLPVGGTIVKYAFNDRRSEGIQRYFTDNELTKMTGNRPVQQFGKDLQNETALTQIANLDYLLKRALLILLAIIGAESAIIYFRRATTYQHETRRK